MVLSGPLEKFFTVDETLGSFALVRGKGDKEARVGVLKGNIAVFTPYALHGPEVCGREEWS